MGAYLIVPHGDKREDQADVGDAPRLVGAATNHDQPSGTTLQGGCHSLSLSHSYSGYKPVSGWSGWRPGNWDGRTWACGEGPGHSLPCDQESGRTEPATRPLLPGILSLSPSLLLSPFSHTPTLSLRRPTLLCLPVFLCVSVSVCLSVFLPVHLSVSVSITPSLSPSVSPSVSGSPAPVTPTARHSDEMCCARDAQT